MLLPLLPSLPPFLSSSAPVAGGRSATTSSSSRRPLLSAAHTKPRTTPSLLRLRSPRCIPSLPHPYIFLSHLRPDPQQQPIDSSRDAEDGDNHADPEDDGDQEEEDEEDEEEEGEVDSDPLRSFFESRIAEPGQRNSSGRNRLIVPAAHSDFIPGGDDDYPDGLSFQGRQSEHKVRILAAEEDGPVVAKVLELARRLPENTTLGEVMGPFVGKVGKEDCVRLLERMGGEHLLVPCLYLWEWMGLQRPPLLCPAACCCLFPVLGEAGMGKELLALFGNLPREAWFRDVHVYNAAISGLASCGSYEDAWKVYEAMEAENVMPDHVTCSVLINVIRKAGGSAKEAWEFFEKMTRKGIKWHVYIVEALVRSFCAEGMKKEALIILSEMEKRGVSSNDTIYNTLMDAYIKSDQIEEAEGLFNEMKEKGLKQTTDTYNILMIAYSRRMQPEIIEDLLVEMGTMGLKPDVKSYTCLISAYGRRKTCDLAVNAFLRMRKAGIKPNSHSYTALIHAYSVGELYGEAQSAFEDMRRQKISPSIETYTALLDAYRRAGDTNMLIEIWKLMTTDKVQGTRVTFNIIVDGLAKQGMYAEARDVVDEFGKLGISPSVMTYNMLMNAYARGGRHNKLPQLLKEMGTFTLKPDWITYMTMIYAYVRVHDFRRAFIYHKEMVKSGQLPDARSYKKLRTILNEKAKRKNKRDRQAILGIVRSSTSILKPKGKKDEFWKNKRKKRLVAARSNQSG